MAPDQRKVPGEKFVASRMRAGRLEMTHELPRRETIGWEPTCHCGITETVPCIVLDPFAGSGTTLSVAKQLGRDYIGIELNEKEYGPLIVKRLRAAEVEKASPEKPTRRAGRRTSVT